MKKEKKVDKLNNLVKEYRKEISSEFPRLSNEDPNTLGDTFEVFVARKIYGPMFSMSDEDIEECFDLSKKNEQSMDLAFLPNPNELHLMECKWKTSSKSVNLDWIDKLVNTPSYLVNRNERDKLPGFIKEKLFDFDPLKKINEVVIYLVTNCSFNDNAREKWQLLTEEAQAHFPHMNLSFVYKDHNTVHDDYSRAQTTEALGSIKVKKVDLFTQENNRFFDLSSLNQGNKDILLGVVSGTEINDWVQQNKNIFHENIRGYRGRNVVNKELLETINEEPQNFLTFNNGITATTTKISDDGAYLTMDKFQIINGCQTATTIHDYSKNAYRDSNGENIQSTQRIQNLKNLRVLVRIVQVDSTASDTGTKAKLIKANNTQTPLKYHDFRSTDKVQIFIENWINKQKHLNYKGLSGPKRVLYQRKTISYRKKSDEIVCKLTDLAEDVYSFEHNSYEIYSNTKVLYDSETNNSSPGKYWLIFGDDGDRVDSLEESRIKQMFGIHFICLHIREEVKKITNEIEKGTREYNLYYLKRIYSSLFGHFMRKALGDDADRFLNDAYSGKLFEKSENSKTLVSIIKNIRNIISHRFEIIEELGRDLQIKNFARQKEEFNKLLEKGEDEQYFSSLESYFKSMLD